MKFILKIIFTILTVIVLCDLSTAQDLSFIQKKEWRKELRKMEKSDQYYRLLMIEKPELNNDSIWRLQSVSDSINKLKFVELTAKYGYPTWERVRRGGSIVLILHFTLEKDYHELKRLFRNELENGNMPPREYAWWYDRCQRNMGLPIYYGQYTNDKFCGEQLNIYNDHRKEIGLEALQPNPNCE